MRQLRRKSGVRSGDRGVALPELQQHQEIARSDARVGLHELRDAKVAAANTRGLLSSNDPAASDEHQVVCQNCGGTTVFTGTLTATRCPYCASPIQRDDIQDAPKTLPVDGVIPFGVDDKVARQNIEKWINSAGSRRRSSSPIGPSARFRACISPISVTTPSPIPAIRVSAATTTRWRSVAATTGTLKPAPAGPMSAATSSIISKMLQPWLIPVSIRNVSRSSSRGRSRRRARSPANTSPDIWPRTYEIGPEEGFQVARREEIDDRIASTVRRDIGGDKQRISSSESRFNPLQFRYLLLPIWLLTVVYDSKPFQVYINGVTGEVQGSRPYSKVKIIAAIVAAIIAITAIVILVQSVR